MVTTPEEITDTPDTLVIELVLDRSLVYIDTLVLSGKLLEKPRHYIKTPPESPSCRPPMMLRMLGNTYGEITSNKTYKIESDGYV
jgi:hypothetical protein